MAGVWEMSCKEWGISGFFIRAIPCRPKEKSQAKESPPKRARSIT
ncbi:hypothetical protein IAE39_003385 [Pseudomonas sp. S37]|nr:hypothetical protein [Pseudomonas sp. S37]